MQTVLWDDNAGGLSTLTFDGTGAQSVVKRNKRNRC